MQLFDFNFRQELNMTIYDYINELFENNKREDGVFLNYILQHHENDITLSVLEPAFEVKCKNRFLWEIYGLRLCETLKIDKLFIDGVDESETLNFMKHFISKGCKYTNEKELIGKKVKASKFDKQRMYFTLENGDVYYLGANKYTDLIYNSIEQENPFPQEFQFLAIHSWEHQLYFKEDLEILTTFYNIVIIDKENTIHTKSINYILTEKDKYVSLFYDASLDLGDG